MRIRERLVTAVHLVLNAVDAVLIRNMLCPMSVKRLHISFDDVYDAFVDVIENNYNSIFDNSFFSCLKKINAKYNAKVSLYLFEDERYILSTSIVQELEECKAWLSVGYHSNVDGHADVRSYRRFRENFRKGGLISEICRIHKFTAEDSLICEMKKSGCRELLCADDKRTSYGIPFKLYEGGIIKDGIKYTQTDVRLEKFCFWRILGLRHKDRLIIFAHERPFQKYCEIQKLEAILKRLPKAIEFDY